MKYLKLFNESFSLEDMHDILLELEDDGFDVNFYPGGVGDHLYEIWIMKDYFKFNDVSEYLLRLQDYLSIEKCRMMVSVGVDSVDRDKLDDPKESDFYPKPLNKLIEMLDGVKNLNIISNIVVDIYKI